MLRYQGLLALFQKKGENGILATGKHTWFVNDLPFCNCCLSALNCLLARHLSLHYYQCCLHEVLLGVHHQGWFFSSKA